MLSAAQPSPIGWFSQSNWDCRVKRGVMNRSACSRSCPVLNVTCRSMINPHVGAFLEAFYSNGIKQNHLKKPPKMWCFYIDSLGGQAHGAARVPKGCRSFWAGHTFQGCQRLRIKSGQIRDDCVKGHENAVTDQV